MIILSEGNFKEKFMNMSTKQKIFISLIVVACIMIFYAVGIITNFFGQPMFSMFFIVSNETAHTLVVYLAIGVAVAISILALIIHFRKPKTLAAEAAIKPTDPLMQILIKSEPTIKATLPLIQIPMKTPQIPIKISSSAYTYKMSSDSERYAANLAAKKKLNSSPAPQIAPTQPKVEKVISPEIKAPEIQKTPNKPEVEPEIKKEDSKTINQGKIICQHCKKEFSTPMMMLDYSTSYPTLVSHCPYCFQPVSYKKTP